MLTLPALGEAIATRRKASGLSQTALARKAGVGRSTLDALENARLGELGFAKVERILAALGLELGLQDAGTRRPAAEDRREEDRDDPHGESPDPGSRSGKGGAQGPCASPELDYYSLKSPNKDYTRVRERPVPHTRGRVPATAAPLPGDLGGAGLRTFFNIARIWKLNEDQQLRLLGLTVRSTLFAWKAKAAGGGPVKLGPDTLERLGNIVGIWKALAILFPQDEIADRWIHLPNDNYPFLGESPLDRMLFSLEGLAQVRHHLDARRGGWG